MNQVQAVMRTSQSASASSVYGAVLALGLMLGGGAPVLAQPAGSAAATGPAAPHYDPKDLTGTWALVDGPFSSAKAWMQAVHQMAPGANIPEQDPKTYPNEHPPVPVEYTPEFAALNKKLQAEYDAGHPYRTGYNCQPNGIWSMMTNGSPIKIFQNGKEMLFMRENVGMLYFVYLDQPHKTEFAVSELFGDSVGKWEGSTLVIDSINMGAHVVVNETEPHSQSYRLVQRVSRPSYDTLQDDMTASDPRAFAKPFTIHLRWRLRPTAEFDEAECMGDAKGDRMAEAPE